jgi:GntR family transcriptional repressor for pyruvate dehydrogenase complex
MLDSMKSCLTAFCIASRKISPSEMTSPSRKPHRLSPQGRLIFHFEHSIRSGALRTGDRLPSEGLLGGQFGLSRPAVREALQSLRTKGLIQSRNGSGSYVAKDPGTRPLRDSMELYSALRRDGRSFLELLDLRLMIECFCVKLLAGSCAEAVREKLAFHLRKMEKATGNMEAFGKADLAFHLAMIEGARHELFSNIMRGLLPELGARFMRETYIGKGLVEKILQEHRSILRALDQGNPTLAAKLLKLHLNASRRHLEELLKKTEHQKKSHGTDRM